LYVYFLGKEIKTQLTGDQKLPQEANATNIDEDGVIGTIDSGVAWTFNTLATGNFWRSLL
jgi:hypothetical protein